MFAIAFLFVRVLCDGFKSRRRLEAEILVLRHQLNVLQQRAPRRLYLTWADHALFVWLYRGFPRMLDAIMILRPETIVRWHRKGFSALSLSQTSSGWQLIENQAILLWDEGSLQTYWFDGGQSAPVAGRARGRDLDVAAANKRSTAGCSKETPSVPSTD